MWYAVSVTPKYEIETAKRINNSGHLAYCPVYQKKLRHRKFLPSIFQSEIRPLFPSYIFVAADASFRKDRYETSRVSLRVYRNAVALDGQMDVIKAVCDAMSAAGGDLDEYRRMMNPKPPELTAGDIVVLRNAIFDGNYVVIERIRKKLVIRLAGDESALSVTVKADQVERVA